MTQNLVQGCLQAGASVLFFLYNIISNIFTTSLHLCMGECVSVCVFVCVREICVLSLSVRYVLLI